MRVKITTPFEVDTGSGRVRYVKGQIVPVGQKNWIDKGLAVEVRAETPKLDKPDAKSAD